MYIIGSRLALSLGVVAASLFALLSDSIASESVNPEPVEISCVNRPIHEPLIQPRPVRNRPFAFNPAMQKVDGIFGIDISRWDHPNDRLLNFSLIRDQQFSFAIIKLSDGATQKAHQLAGRWWKIDRLAAEKAGFLVGGYHFAYPRGQNPAERRQDALKQAQMAAKRYGAWKPGRLPLVLDLEVLPSPKWTPRELTDWALTFLTEAERITSHKPMIYSYANYFLKHMEPDLRLVEYPLWIAHYGVHLSSPAKIVPWALFDDQAIWQFSSSGRTLGMHRNIGDLNVAQPHWLQKLVGRKNDHNWATPLSEAQIAAFNSIARNGNGERFHNRTGSTREGLTTWQTWANSSNRCSSSSGN